MQTTKSNWIRRESNPQRLTGLLLAALLGAASYGWAQESKPQTKNMGDLPVYVGESVRIEVDEATTVALADPAIADHQIPSKREILVNGKKPGVTTLHIWEASGTHKTYRIVVTEGDFANKSVKEAINLPHVNARVVGNAIILEGTVGNERELERALNVAGSYREKVVNLIEVLDPVQVRIRIQVAEINLSSAKKKGLEYPDSIIYSMDLVGENKVTGNTALGLGNPFATVLHGFTSVGTDGLLNAPSEIDSSVFVKLNLLQQNGDLRILAEPTLLTLSGKEASFLAGGEFPVVIALQNTFSVEFKEFGVRMKIKPVVDSQTNINMLITAELSAIDPTRTVSSSTIAGGVNLPFLTTRKASTSLQVKGGQTIMIGGLLERATTDVLRKVPWIGEVPVLGLLFTSKAKDNVERELIFLVTPDLVRDPSAEAAAAVINEQLKGMMNEPKWQETEAEAKKAHGKGN